MGSAEDDELRELRARAYGPRADIRLNSRDQLRLRALEEARRYQPPPPSDAVIPPAPSIESIDVPSSDDDPHLGADEQKPAAHDPFSRVARLALVAGRRLARVRRSTRFVALGLAVAAIVVGAALVLVERVQPDPLQIGADQVARLSINTSYQLPGMFQSMVNDGTPVDAFQEFYGLRAVVTARGQFSNDEEAECFTIFSADESESGFTGGGCVAGPFPAMTQFKVSEPSLPDELQAAFPGVSALQLVYDSVNREIVIFAGE